MLQVSHLFELMSGAAIGVIWAIYFLAPALIVLTTPFLLIGRALMWLGRAACSKVETMLKPRRLRKAKKSRLSWKAQHA